MPRKGHVVKTGVLPICGCCLKNSGVLKKSIACVLSSFIFISNCGVVWANHSDLTYSSKMIVNNCVLEENEYERVASEIKNGKVYVAIFDKNKNVLT